jgi:cyclase
MEFVKLPAGKIALCITCICLTAIYSVSFNQTAQNETNDNSELTKLADDVYAGIVSPEGNAVGNSGVVVLDNGVLVFDTHFTPEAGQSLMSALRSVTSKPVRYVINSHWHADHTHGNQAFADAQMISSTNARRDMQQMDIPSMNRNIKIAQTQLEELGRSAVQEQDSIQKERINSQIKARRDFLDTMSRLKFMTPVVTFDDSIKIQDGKREIRLYYYGKGHTDGDILMLVPDAKIVFLGDLFFNDAIPNVQDASILEWMKTLGKILELDADKFVPGHGPVGSKSDVKRFLDYFEELKAMIEPAIARGESREQVTNGMLLPIKYSSCQFQSFFPFNVQKMYAELMAQKVSASQPGEGRKPESKKPAR